jgi:AcrR family transcriptional regulator
MNTLDAKTAKPTRPYEMTARAASTDETRASILRAAFALSAEKLSTDIVLADVAARSGVTVKTILRHFGSREALFDAVIEFATTEVKDERSSPVGDIDAAIATVHAHYELRGEWVMRMLGQEHSDPRIHDIVSNGRAVHREWVESTFRPQLEAVQDPTAATDLLVVATDIYTWKLLRRDLDLSIDQTQQRVCAFVRAILNEGN